jgi:hypothetical protein
MWGTPTAGSAAIAWRRAMRHSRGVVALFCSLLLGLALVAAARPDPGRGSDAGGRRAGAAPLVGFIRTAPDLGKRW